MKLLQYCVAACAVALAASWHPPAAALGPNQDPFEHRPAADALSGTTVDLDAIDEHADRYVGLTVVVAGTVDRILGPRLFRITDEDADSELLIGMPAPLVAAVRAGDRVTATGLLKPFTQAEFAQSWKWLGLDDDDALDLALDPIVVSARVATADGRLVTRMSGDTTVMAPDTVIARGDADLVGRSLWLEGGTVSGVNRDGFFVASGGAHLFVLAGEASAAVRAGDRLSIGGIVLSMPDQIEDRLAPPRPANTRIILYANVVERPRP